MNALLEAIRRIWAQPTPADLWALQAPLLALDSPQARAAHALAGQFYAYLSALESKLSSQRYSRLAAMLQASAVAVVGLEDALTGGRVNLRELLTAGLGGALEVMAAIQEVHAWQMETRTVDAEVAWDLHRALWELSAEMQPELAHEERAAHLDRLLAPLHAPATPDAARALLIIRLFQLTLTIRLLPLVEVIGLAEQ